MPVHLYHLSVPETLICPRYVPRAPGKAKRGLIKYGRLCVPHVPRYDEDRTVVIPWSLWAGKFVQFTLESIRDFLERIRLFSFALKSSSAYFLGSSEFSSKFKSISSIKSLSEAPFLFYVSSLPPLTRAFSFLDLFFFGSLSSPVTGWVCLVNRRDG